MTDESGMLNDTYLKKYSDQLKGLNLRQAQFTLSTTALSSAQKEQVLVEAGLIASKDKIKASLVASTLAQSIDNEEKRKAILGQLGLYDMEKKELLLIIHVQKLNCVRLCQDSLIIQQKKKK